MTLLFRSLYHLPKFCRKLCTLPQTKRSVCQTSPLFSYRNFSRPTKLGVLRSSFAVPSTFINDRALFSTFLSKSSTVETAADVKAKLLSYEPLSSQLKCDKVGAPPSPENLPPITMVDTSMELEALAKRLNSVYSFALDLEGLVDAASLMQISTRTHNEETDYIIDLISLRTDILLLQEVFADLEIVKVMHGCRGSDLTWLRRDCGLHLVGVFDTEIAMQLLGYKPQSLRRLVKLLADVELTKIGGGNFDQRPLTPAQKEYARNDTHYLPFCYEVLKQRLGSEGVRLVLLTGRDQCLKHYKKTDYPDDGEVTNALLNSEVKVENVSVVLQKRSKGKQLTSSVKSKRKPKTSKRRRSETRLSAGADASSSLLPTSDHLIRELNCFGPSKSQRELVGTTSGDVAKERKKPEFVTNERQLKVMIRHLSSCNQIGLHLKEFGGRTCFIGLSTSDADFIVDTLALRDRLQVLSGPFANPNIVKVVHDGVPSTVLSSLWRDFGLILIGSFNTRVGLKKLGGKRLGLPHLRRSIGVTVIKRRVGLRCDERRAKQVEDVYKNICYLLPCYAVLKQKLARIDPKLIVDVFLECRESSVKLYKKPRTHSSKVRSTRTKEKDYWIFDTVLFCTTVGGLVLGILFATTCPDAYYYEKDQKWEKWTEVS